MTPGEEYDLKRESFIHKASMQFKFLVDEFGYSEPIYRISKQDNGAIIKDEFKYENKSIDRVIAVSNAYHPYDYGFDILFYRPSVSMLYSDGKMAISVLKENQDLEQTYIEPTAQKFKKEFLGVITGEKWIDNL